MDIQELKRILSTCSREDLAEYLVQIPEVIEYAEKQINIGIKRLVEPRLPFKLLEAYYLEDTYGLASKALKQYILNNFKPSEISILLDNYKLNNIK